jgi:hypothetical protein
MTWAEIKAIIEAAGIRDDHEILYMDFKRSGPNAITEVSPANRKKPDVPEWTID